MEETPHFNQRHGHARRGKVSRTFHAWQNMRRRCLDKNNKRYARYGGRGITVCEQWLIFENFLGDMGVCPDGLVIDRIDNDKGYFKENCRWATKEQSAWNRGANKNNTSGFRGVSLYPNGKYMASVRFNHVQKTLGYFTTKEEAYACRELWVKNHT